MNKDLYGKNYPIPPHVLKHLQSFANNEIIGNLINTQSISYSQLKKIKHDIDNGRKAELGGDVFYGWVNQTLNSDRSSLEVSKNNRSNTGMQNAHNQTHTNDTTQGLKDLNRPSQSHSVQNDDIKINEALKRINELISKLI